MINELMPLVGKNNLRIPKVYHGLSSRKVLITEWIDGRSITDHTPEEVK